ncbi:diguanylate cyclase domain-containing protein [Thioflexithrix psekupsensis]|uniref:Uncharacterized protein n=1 Tax=Thioflexithrix psekupsensis TaxID=1570016 RepID=A0A251X4P1_9GAMM|nr:diguanylate cyclase [Thioflexithrix psekupsensis]OUD12112.1 hypothetical protein TPSD3_13370 [Thioflexithrix psekupsensis]
MTPNNFLIEKVLIVEDNVNNAEFLKDLLTHHHFAVYTVNSGVNALDFLDKKNLVDLILVDVLMPEMDGFELCQRLKANPRTNEIPLIFMTAMTELSEKIKGFALGAVDYITKPVQESELLARINTHLQLYRLKKQVAERNQELEKTLIRQSAILDNTPLGIVFLSSDRILLEMNQKAADLFGYKKSELIHQTTKKLYATEQDYENLGKEAYALLKKGEIYNTERLMKRKDGSLFWCHLRGNLLKRFDLTQGSIWSLEDVTERKKIEDEARLASNVFETMSDAILITDPNNQILKTNPAFTEVTGYQEMEVLGKNPNILSAGRHDHLFYRQMWTVLLTKDQWQGEVWNRRKNGMVYPAWLKIKVVRRPNQAISNYVAIFTDITERKRAEELLQHQANYDNLTGLPNRMMFNERVQLALQNVQECNKKLAILYIDLDGFKSVNDKLGHEAGDKVLIRVANQLNQIVRAEDTVSRLGGDEFAVILSQLEQVEHVQVVARRILEKLSLKVEEGNIILWVSASVGISIFPDNGEDEMTLLRLADQAMFHAKFMGKNTFYQMPPHYLQEKGMISTEESALGFTISEISTLSARLLCVENDPEMASLLRTILGKSGYDVRIEDSGQAFLATLQQNQYELLLMSQTIVDIDYLQLIDHIKKIDHTIPIVLLLDTHVTLTINMIKRGVVDYVRKDENLADLLPLLINRSLENSRLFETRQQLRNAEQQQDLYRGIFDALFTPLFIFNSEGKIIETNATACCLFGYAEHELIGVYGKSLFSPKYHSLFHHFLNIDTDFSHITIEVMNKQGKAIAVELYRSLIHYQNQAHLLAVLHDVSEQKRKEQYLNQIATLFEYSVDAMLIANADRCIVAANQAFSDLTGYDKNEVLGKNFFFLNKESVIDYSDFLWGYLNRFGYWQGIDRKVGKHNQLIICWERINKVLAHNGEVSHYICVFSDVNRSPLPKEKIHYLSDRDPLTNLPNQSLLNQCFKCLLELKKHEMALLLIDVDGFKKINDEFGFHVANQLLEAMANRLLLLNQGIKNELILARVGGDEFALLQEPFESLQTLVHFVQQLLEQFKQPFYLEHHEIYVSLSIGIALYPQDGKEMTHLLDKANQAMLNVKQRGGGNYQFYGQKLTQAAQLRLNLEADLREAIHSIQANNQLFLLYQPQIDLESKKIIGAEVFVRWQHVNKGIINPLEFLSLAEETGLIFPLGEWILRTACQQMHLWKMQGLLHHIAINLSSSQLKQGDIVGLIKEILMDVELLPSDVELEMTELSLAQEINGSSRVLSELRDLGVSLAIDDFGMGYSSIHELKKLPVNKLKLDGSFLPQTEEKQQTQLAAAMIALGRGLNLRVISEGVEQEWQEVFLQQQGCHEAQGFLYSRPVTASAFEAQLKRCG